MSESTNPLIPVVHLNGSGAETLVKGWAAVEEAVVELRAVIGRLEFNARDYYPKGEGAWIAADGRMVGHLRALEALRKDAFEVIQALDQIEVERRRRRGNIPGA